MSLGGPNGSSKEERDMFVGKDDEFSSDLLLPGTHDVGLKREDWTQVDDI